MDSIALRRVPDPAHVTGPPRGAIVPVRHAERKSLSAVQDLSRAEVRPDATET